MRYAYTPHSLQANMEFSGYVLSQSLFASLFENRVKQIDSDWLLASPRTGAWCLLNNEEFAFYNQLHSYLRVPDKINLGEAPPQLRALLKHFVRCGLLDDNQGTVHEIYPRRPFSLTIYKSDRCNLVCKYCYLAMTPKQIGRELPTETARSVILDAFETGFERLLLDFGEIAIDYRSIHDLVLYAENLQKFYPQKQLIISVQTNGTMLRHDVIDFLQEHNIIVGVSLDGPQELHDRMRISANGYGSHARTERGLREIIRRGMPHIVLCTISSANVRSANQILDYFLNIGVSHFSFKPVIRRGHATTRWQSTGISTNEYRDFLRSVMDYTISSRTWDALDDRFIKFIFRLLRDPRGWSDRCPTLDCGCGIDMLVVNPEGSIYPCPRFSSTSYDGQQIGKSLSQAISTASQMRLSENFYRGTSKCHHCVWWAVCKGGCPLSRVENYSTTGTVADPFCEIYDCMYDLIVTQLLPKLSENGKHTSSKLGTIGVTDTDIFSEVE